MLNNFTPLILLATISVPVISSIFLHDVSKIHGLFLGLLTIVSGHCVTILYFCIQSQNKKLQYNLKDVLIKHVTKVEGFLLLAGYLICSWNFMPITYHSSVGGIQWGYVLLQLLVQDGIQYIFHLCEHHPGIYRFHKAHHHYINPTFFIAFHGSITDTFVMVIVPLFITAHIIPANMWSYMTFGSIYSNWLVIIHSEYEHPWDPLFRRIGFGTPADHHIHHKLLRYNYGHIFMYWDIICGTYKSH
jgi:sterol desaturase/sphingolipid hydroxylase (fatty acid hydroxylase superfamily)